MKKLNVLFLLTLILALIPTKAADPVAILLECGDNLRFSRTELSVKSGAKVTVTLKNTGRNPALKLNFVLLRAEADVMRFGNAAMSANNADAIPSKYRHWVLANTKLIKPGESDSVNFTAPPPGTYTFICSYPGHFSLAQGKMTVK